MDCINTDNLDAGHNGEGDYEYDHEAFLGEEYSAQFDELRYILCVQ